VQNASKSYERILTKFSGGVDRGRGRKNNRLDFGGSPNHDPDPGFQWITIRIHGSWIWIKKFYKDFIYDYDSSIDSQE